MSSSYTERQKTLIVNNVKKACSDISSLNKTGYNFLYQCRGLIAHYGLGGFKDFYSDGDLRRTILEMAPLNQWENFRGTDQNYEYYMSRKAVYNAIVEAIR